MAEANPLFDFIKLVFNRNAKWESVRTPDKNKFFFIMNRIMSIMYPVQANMFNHTRISKSDVVDYWHYNLGKIYTSTPQWVWPKTAKNTKKTAAKRRKNPSRFI